ncbi:MAG TPA: four helix bundle protein [Fimbriimonadaceae bacterium]|jgi:four helix bundle protein
MTKSFRDLIVWQQGVALVEDIYRASDGWPKSEDYALTSQIRRSAVSIPSNIAEGSGRGTVRDYQHFLRIARGSVRELETQIEIAFRVRYVESAKAEALQSKLASVSKLLNRLIKSLESGQFVREEIALYEP